MKLTGMPRHFPEASPTASPMVRGPLKFRDLSGAAILAALALVAGACSDPQGAKNSSSPRRDSAEVSRSLDDEVDLFMAKYPKVIRGKFGTSDTSPYLKIRRPRLTDAPYGPEDGVLSIDYLGAPHPTEMPALSRVVVRGRVVAIGLPHFNSTDGSFWDPELHEEPGTTDVAKTILRDVLFRVDEVWGSLLPGLSPDR